MPVVDKTPQALRPYTSHGVDLVWSDGNKQANGVCPFCDKRKFGVDTEDGLYKCFACQVKGNALTFLRELWDRGTVPADQLAKLGAEKGVGVDALKAWGLKWVRGGWVCPGYDAQGRMCQLYKWARNPATKKMMWYATTGMGTGLLGMGQWDESKESVWVAEGHWDGPRLWEELGKWKRGIDGKLARTGNPEVSLRAKVNVVAVPGATSWDDEWARRLFKDKNVTLWYDSDHRKETPPDSGKFTQAGYDGMRRAVEKLGAAAERPKTVHVVKWGPDGFDPARKSGWDVRDHLNDETAGGLESLLALAGPPPEEWVPGRTAGDVKGGAMKLRPVECTSYKKLLHKCKAVLKWSDDLDHLLPVALATVLSTGTVGVNVWTLVSARPGSGKSSIMKGISVASEYVETQFELNLMYSGYKVDKEGSENYSLAGKLDGKTLLIEDLDSLLKSPIRGKVLSQLRALFDGEGSSHFNNGMSEEFRVRFTTLLNGTGSVRELDTAEQGGRFILCCFSDDIDDEHEDDVCSRIFHREVRGSRVEMNGAVESRMSKEEAEMRKHIGGYVQHLRRNAGQIMSQVDDPPPRAEGLVKACAKFVANMRARPSKTQDEVAERELASRLTAQYARLMMCITGAMGKTEIDADVLSRVRRCALDTARGKTLDLAGILYRAKSVGHEAQSLSVLTGEAPEKLGPLLRFLRKIGVTEWYQPDLGNGRKGTGRWRLTTKMEGLYRTVVEQGK